MLSRHRVGVGVITLLVSGFTIAQPSAPPTADASAPTIQVQTGQVLPTQQDGVLQALGIPFAKPPVGALRWRAPQDAAPWDGVRDASHFGNACAQIGNFYTTDNTADFDKPFGSEDCLYLNIWAPAEAHQRPVLVFIHGGGGVFGAGSYGAYDGRRLARELDAVVVSTNYRLGIFGGIEVDALRSGDPLSDSGSLWLLDQIKALEWVAHNIAAFGGDPGNVTVMGHSAGGVSVLAMLRSPLATGKFSKAVVLSAFPAYTEPEERQQRSTTFLTQVMRRDGTLADEKELQKHLKRLGDEGLRTYLYAKPASDLIEASRGIRAVVGGGDDAVLRAPKTDPHQDFPNPVPMLIGMVDNEASMLFLLEGFSKLTPLQFWDVANQVDAEPTRRDLFTWFGDWRFRLSTSITNIYLRHKVTDAANRLTQAGAPVYRYYFDWNDQPQPWRSVLGSYHGLDVPFVFGNFRDSEPNFGRFSWTPETVEAREAIHSAMAKALKGFVESGDPNRYPSQMKWPLWDASHEMTVIR
ncbi:carboxylesterase family protein [Sinimarinibacterium sp. CAU 1509]|uniref:carboxylesterase/lipase family protein n=1 Tax=Sinimarinibacterium sp. CAU 1509 TaxID=2562283 RepID=UPI0010AC7684|nr:carboxylesterase family protein [Sinimarinibacterium sp. CAU 1509]TJY60001.1 carboxylesterase family protein [Sinimarinibacterium sp. CAU 1509]